MQGYQELSISKSGKLSIDVPYRDQLDFIDPGGDSIKYADWKIVIKREFYHAARVFSSSIAWVIVSCAASVYISATAFTLPIRL